MRTFGREWYRMSSAPIPTVLLNGSLIGYIHEDPVGTQRFEEIASYPLQSDELKEVLDLVKTLVHDSLTNLLVFYYPRDWQKGEIIWTPAEETIPQVQEKYKSAALVWSSPLDSLGDKLHEEDINMIFLHADVPTDGRMAYQHSSRRDFFTRKGVDKLWGTQRIAEQLGFRLDASLGAGDTSMDVFLGGVAQAVHVGRALDHHGTLPSIILSCSEEFGALLKELAAWQLAHKTINT
jgi:hydroxymethylpyrimidine pyrophosphatase-like HAD family hydrolase